MNSNPAERQGLSQAKCVCRMGGQHGGALPARVLEARCPPWHNRLWQRPRPPHYLSLQISLGLFSSPKVFGVGELLTPAFVLSARLKIFPSRLLMPHYLPLKERTTLLLL